MNKNHLRNIVLLIFMAMFATNTKAQTTPEAYRLYDAKGNATSYRNMINALAKANVVLVGEMHNCPITHWLELKILESLYQRHGKALGVGFEMLEADNQLILDEYMQGIISAERFENEMRLWPNHSTDYAPLLLFARDKGLHVVATNVPRRYANVVKNRGLAFLDSLSTLAKTFLPPLPVPFIDNEHAHGAFALMGMMGKKNNADPVRMAQAQAIKDATMAWFIAQNLAGAFVHFNGSYHSDNNDGIVAYLKRYCPEAKVMNVKAVRQENIGKLEEDYKGMADFYICIPEDMNTSY